MCVSGRCQVHRSPHNHAPQPVWPTICQMNPEDHAGRVRGQGWGAHGELGGEPRQAVILTKTKAFHQGRD